MEYPRMVIRGNVTFQSIDDLAIAEGWVFQREYTMLEGSRQYEKIWKTPSGKHQIHYIYDDIIQVQYFLVAGATPWEAMVALSQIIPSYSIKELLETYAGAKSLKKLVNTSHQLAVSAPPTYDKRIFDALQKLLDSDNPDVRYEGLVAVGYVGWKEFKTKLEEIVKFESEKHVKDLAITLLKSFASKGWRN